MQSDEESTELVMQRKPMLERPLSMPMEEDLWWDINQDFALDSGAFDDDIIPQKAAKPAQKSVSTTTTLSDDEWMEINQDFACEAEHSDVNMERPAKKAISHMQEPYGDYGVWWE